MLFFIAFYSSKNPEKKYCGFIINNNMKCFLSTKSAGDRSSDTEFAFTNRF